MRIKKRFSAVLSLILVIMLAFSGLTAFAEDYDANEVDDVVLSDKTDDGVMGNDDDTTNVVEEEEAYEEKDVETPYERDAEKGDEGDSPVSRVELVEGEEPGEEEVISLVSSDSLIPEVGRIAVMKSDGEWIYLPQGIPLGNGLGIHIYDTNDERIGYMSPVPAWMVSGLDTSVLGSQIATITLGVHTTTVEVRIVPVEDHVECTCSQPDLHLFVMSLGATWDGVHVVGMTLEQADWIAVIECRTCDVYISASQVTAEMVSGFDSSTPGTRTVTVNYQGLSYTKEVTFVALPPEAFIEISDLVPFVPQGVPIDELFLMGTLIIPVEGVEEFQWNRIWFRITSDMVSGFCPSIVGLQRVTVTYLDVTAVFYIEVVYDPYFFVEYPANGGNNGGITPGGTVTTPSTPSGNDGGTAPQTGDSLSLALISYIMMAIGSFGIITRYAMDRRKKIKLS